MASRTAPRPWIRSEPSDASVLKREPQTPNGTFLKRETQSMPAIIENIPIAGDANLDLKREAPARLFITGGLEDLLYMSGQSTPARGSYHNSPIQPATPRNSSNSALHAQHRLARSFETLAMANTHKQQALTTPAMQAHRCRRTHGHVTIKTRTSQLTGFAALLCIESGFISVVGGAELDDTILSMPLRYAELKVVPGHENLLELKVKNPDAKPNGIL